MSRTLTREKTFAGVCFYAGGDRDGALECFDSDGLVSPKFSADRTNTLAAGPSTIYNTINLNIPVRRSRLSGVAGATCPD